MWKHKLLFVETPDAMETSIALKNYREVSPASTSAMGGAKHIRPATMAEER